MNDAFTQRVRSAAVAGWWTVVIGAIWMTIAWLFFLVILSAEPGWMMTLWGDRMTWKEVHSLVITFMAAFKMILFVCLLVTIWLTVWSRRLKRSAGS